MVNSNAIPNTRSTDSNIFFLSELPEPFIIALAQFVTSVLRCTREIPKAGNEALWNATYSVKRFLDLYCSIGSHSFISAKQTQLEGTIHDKQFKLQLSLNNVICTDHIRERFNFLESSVLFSATLQPFDLYSQLLGIPAHQTRVTLPSPYRSEQINLHFANISTRFNDRDATLGTITQQIGQQFYQKPGNYLIFASSYAYIENLFKSFKEQFPDIPSIVQVADMNIDVCNRFIKRFNTERGLMGFALLGGGFSEGISLEGDSLIGVFIINIGLPAANAENEKVSEIIENHFGEGTGYSYTYVYPAIRKVTQAVGRLIRGPQDSGSVHLIDRRFNQERYRNLLPRWWAE
ncbi:helicase C-terminal domain-containing protein [Nitrincola tibetensis]|uniref:helicase C-terminal domain-containing protein n=1 Tax=Nitrincola tibetensis TaxID=2219697 RepID=UPI001390440E|nr:helicase C-terminal domain-containing protein [Nitrincola tibetensis]